MPLQAEIILALTGMGVAAVGAIVGALVGGWSLRQRYAARRLARLRAQKTIEWPPTWQEILEENGGVPPLVSRKRKRRLSPNHHNIRCAVCGRFAARVEAIPGVGQCRVHGMSMTTPIATMTTERQQNEEMHQLDHA